MESVTIPLVNVTVRMVGEITIAARKFAYKIVISMEFAKMVNVPAMKASKVNSAKNLYARITVTIEGYAIKENATV